MRGASYLRVLKSRLPSVKRMRTGGLNINTVNFCQQTQLHFAGASELVDIAAVNDGRAHVLNERASEFVTAVAAARKK